ncbi:MAG: transposase, partial [Nevskia sp.]|nr:transposase [Nevskia sp.]
STATLGDAKVCDQLLHGDEQIVRGDRAYASTVRQVDAPREDGEPLYAMPFKRKPHEDLPYDQRQANRLLASLRSKVEHPFRVLKRQFGYPKVRYRGLEKNTAQLHTLFACVNLWMARKNLMAAGSLRPPSGNRTPDERKTAI